MRGEFLFVWEDTYRCIWEPLSYIDDVSNDVYSQLYQELWKALKVPSGEDALHIPLGDSIQLREAFFQALATSGTQIERQHAEDAFIASLVTEQADLMTRKVVVENLIGQLVEDHLKGQQHLAAALGTLANSPLRKSEAMQRILENIVNDTEKSKTAFHAVRSSQLLNEQAVIIFLESVFDVLNDLGGDALSNEYFNLLAGFIEKFSLRYDLRRPCVLCPTLPGVFVSLVRDLRMIASADPHLDALMKDFENAVRDLRYDCTDGRIRVCIQRQVNFLEAIGRSHPDVTEGELGAMCKQLHTWPHMAVRAALSSLYGFASDYPGIRHGGNPAGKVRDVDMRDLIAMSILFTGFTPYLSNVLNPEAVYGGT